MFLKLIFWSIELLMIDPFIIYSFMSIKSMNSYSGGGKTGKTFYSYVNLDVYVHTTLISNEVILRHFSFQLVWRFLQPSV
jgi:hypothetical protein